MTLELFKQAKSKTFSNLSLFLRSALEKWLHYNTYLDRIVICSGEQKLENIKKFREEIVKLHEKYLTQYRAVFVVNCKVGGERLLHQSIPKPRKRKRQRQRGSDESGVNPAVGETFKQVFCQVCSTEVGVMDQEEVYHFFNVLPSES